MFWFRRMRRSIPAIIFVALAVTMGMWMERFVIIVISLHQDYLPSSWHKYIPTKIDFGILLGSSACYSPWCCSSRVSCRSSRPAR